MLTRFIDNLLLIPAALIFLLMILWPVKKQAKYQVTSWPASTKAKRKFALWPMRKQAKRHLTYR